MAVVKEVRRGRWQTVFKEFKIVHFQIACMRLGKPNLTLVNVCVVSDH